MIRSNIVGIRNTITNKDQIIFQQNSIVAIQVNFELLYCVLVFRYFSNYRCSFCHKQKDSIQKHKTIVFVLILSRPSVSLHVDIFFISVPRDVYHMQGILMPSNDKAILPNQILHANLIQNIALPFVSIIVSRE